MVKRFEPLHIRVVETSAQQVGIVVIQNVTEIPSAFVHTELQEHWPDSMMTKAIDYELNRRKI
jgi:hypothetical protein